MSRIDDILTGVQTAIEANTTFSTAAAIVLRRRELNGDAESSHPYVFLRVLNPKPLSDAPQICDMRTYPVEIVVKFTYEGRTVDEDVKDPVDVLKATYSDALKTAMNTLLPSPNAPVATITNLMNGNWVSEDLEYKETNNDELGRAYRIQQIWNFNTYELISDVIVLNIKDRDVATLGADGTVVVSSTDVTTIDRIFLTKVLGNNSDAISVGTVVVGTSFKISSAGGAVDASLPVGWFIL
jgi:hypothetical protein